MKDKNLDGMVLMSRLEKITILGIIIVVLLFGKSLIPEGNHIGELPDPVQIKLNEPKTISITGQSGDVDITLLAEYTIEAVVKSKKKYNSDYPSQVSSYDLALAWGNLNKEEIDKNIKYSQRSRWYFYRYTNDNLVGQDYISKHSTNVHIIHKDDSVLKELKSMRENDRVKLEGYLVNVNFSNGPWKSSLTRSDTGNGSCEIMYVINVDIIE